MNEYRIGVHKNYNDDNNKALCDLNVCLVKNNFIVCMLIYTISIPFWLNNSYNVEL